MYRLAGTKAYRHGVYIRPGEYVELWRDVSRLARELEISVSEFTSHTMHLALKGRVAKMSRVHTRKKRRKVAA